MRETSNNLKVVGLLKNIKVKEDTNKKGKPYLSMTLTVSSKDGDKIRENRVDFYTNVGSKLEKGYRTVIDTFKTIDRDGEENATRVEIDGSLVMNEYISNGEYHIGTRLKGLFCREISKDELNGDGTPVIDGVQLYIEGVLSAINQVSNKEGLPNGELGVTLFTVGYEERIEEITGIKVSKEMANDFQKLFKIGNSVEFYVSIENLVEIEEKPTTCAFGSQLNNVSDNVVKNYINNSYIVGGNILLPPKSFNPEEVKAMSVKREMAKKELTQVPSTPQMPQNKTAFGNNFVPTGSASTSSSSFGDMPF